MEIEKLNVNQIPENGIIKILSGKCLDEKEPKVPKEIIGAINTPFEVLSKRLNFLDTAVSHAEFNYEDTFITIIFNEDDHLTKVVTGRMIKTKALLGISINSGKNWNNFELADFFRLNRNLFEDKAIAMKIIAQLSNFKAKVDKELEQTKDNRANYNLQKRQVVESNLPDSFKLILPIFKGMPKQEVNVEVDINPNSLDCVLISPELAEIIDKVAVNMIDDQLKAIAALCPELPIIEV